MYSTMTEPLHVVHSELAHGHTKKTTTIEDNIKAAIHSITIPFKMRMTYYLDFIEKKVGKLPYESPEDEHILATALKTYKQRKIASIEEMSYQIFAIMVKDLPDKITIRTTARTPAMAKLERTDMLPYVTEGLRLFNDYQTKCHEFFAADMQRYVQVVEKRLNANYDHVAVSFNVVGIPYTPVRNDADEDDITNVSAHVEREIKAVHGAFIHQFVGNLATIDIEKEELKKLGENKASTRGRTEGSRFFIRFNTIGEQAFDKIIKKYDEALSHVATPPRGDSAVIMHMA